MPSLFPDELHQYNYQLFRSAFDAESKIVNKRILDNHVAYLDFHRFSYIHIATGDVDPIYSAIRYSDLTDSDKHKLMFSHLMVYDLKQSIRLAQEPDETYYDLLTEMFTKKQVGQDRKDVAERETNPKSRSFNTQINKMRNRSPSDWMGEAISLTLCDCDNWINSVKSGQIIPTFGEYFGFKTADMIETIFDYNHKVVWDDGFKKTIPRGSLTGYECVRTGHTKKFRDTSEIREDDLMREFYLNEIEHFKDFQNPHKPVRGIGVQEIETLLCDYRKYRRGTLDFGQKTQKLMTGINANKGHIVDGLTNIVHAMVNQKDEVMKRISNGYIPMEESAELSKFLLKFEG